MKKVLLIFAFVLVGQLGFSQDSFKDDTMKLLSINGSSSQLEVAKGQILKMIPEAKQADFNKEFAATLPSFYEKMAKAMMDVYTHDEIKQQIAFYESPIGKKIQEKAGLLQEKSMEAAQSWSAELQGILMKYMQ